MGRVREAISGGADGAVVVYSPSRCGESSLFELVEVDDFEDDFDDDDEDAGVLDSLYDALDALQDGHDADADAALARAALFGRRLLPRAEGRPHHHRAPADAQTSPTYLGR